MSRLIWISLGFHNVKHATYILEGHHFAHNDPHRFGLRLGTGERDDQDRRGPKIKVARWITRCLLPQCFLSIDWFIYIYTL